jgi:hypothetical protein
MRFGVSPREGDGECCDELEWLQGIADRDDFCALGKGFHFFEESVKGMIGQTGTVEINECRLGKIGLFEVFAFEIDICDAKKPF